MLKLLFFLNIINISIADPIYNDYDDDDDTTINYNFKINFYNSSNCKGKIIKNLNYYHDCDINNHNSCCRNIMDYYNLTEKYNLTEECSYNDDYYIIYQCTEVNNKNNFTLLFTIFYIIFSIIFLYIIFYCYLNNHKFKKKDIELQERKPIVDKNFNNSDYFMSHLNR